VLVVVALVATALGLGLMLLVGLVIASDPEYFDPSVDLDLFLFGLAGVLVARQLRPATPRGARAR
jgi:hypothetical protein